jgi:hypothetical protein
MLNVDAHSDKVKKKMTKLQFIHNCRGINEGGNLPTDFLEEIYDRITAEEIVILEESNSPGTPPSLYANSLKKGWITAKISLGSKVLHKWRRMFFILMPSALYYFKKQGDIEFIGKFELSDLKMKHMRLSRKDRKFCIQLEAKTEEVSEDSKKAISPQQQLINRSRRKSIKSPSLAEEELMEVILSVNTERELVSWARILRRFIDKNALKMGTIELQISSTPPTTNVTNDLTTITEDRPSEDAEREEEQSRTRSSSY